MSDKQPKHKEIRDWESRIKPDFWGVVDSYSLEELYQAFKARMKREEAEAPQ